MRQKNWNNQIHTAKIRPTRLQNTSKIRSDKANSDKEPLKTTQNVQVPEV